jgi:hypothetical protein
MNLPEFPLGYPLSSKQLNVVLPRLLLFFRHLFIGVVNFLKRKTLG